MEKVRPWCGQPSDRGRLRNRTEQNDFTGVELSIFLLIFEWALHTVRAALLRCL